MTGRTQRFIREARRFAAVGLLATAVSFLLFNFLVHGLFTGIAPLNGHAVTGYLIANLVGMAISYTGTVKYAFPDRRVRHADGGVTAFIAINLITMLIPMACLTTSRHVLGLTDAWSDNIAANVVGLALGFVARFWLFRYGLFTINRELDHRSMDGLGVDGFGVDGLGVDGSVPEVRP